MPLTRIQPDGLDSTKDFTFNKLTTNTVIVNGVDVSTGGGPKITNIQVTNSSYTVLDDTAVALTGGYIKITGTGFVTGCQVLINNTPATSVSFVSATEVRAQVPATSAGTYVVYLVNPDGGVAIRVNGITFSGNPTWVTGGTLPTGQVNAAISIQLSATGDAPLVYSLQAGSSLPSGVTLSSGGLLSGTVTGITNETTYNFTIEVTDPELQESPRAFSITISANDANFKNITLLLSANTPNATFVSDASSNAFAITVNGDTRPNNFGPYTPGYYSNFFDGNGDFLTVPSSTNVAFNLNNTDWTIEFWFYAVATPSSSGFGNQIIQAQQGTNNWLPYVSIGVNSSLFLVASINAVQYTTTQTFAVNVWNHVALVRNSGVVRLYLNGVATSVAPTADIANTNLNFWIGKADNATGGGGYLTYFNGYISNLRIVKGTAVYTSDFTPPTSPLTAISGTSLLTCQSNRFIDNSTNDFAITRNGDTTINGFDPFVPASNTATYGSGYFDGTGDYLSVASNAALTFGTGDFTIEGWHYLTAAASSTKYIFDCRSGGGSQAAPLLLIQSSAYQYYVNGAYVASGGTPLPNVWTHFALVKTSGSTKLYINGTSVFTYSDSVNYTSSTIRIGSEYGAAGTFDWQGYISNFRVVKGTAVYTTTFTPPTSPLTAISGTSLLTLQSNQPTNNSMFVDNSSLNNLITRNGNTTQGSFSPYPGTWSNYFDGTGDWLTFTGATTGSGNFTTEAWVYLATLRDYQLIFDNRATGASATGYAFGVDVAGKPYMYTNNGFQILSSIVITANTWNHVALVRSGTTITLYVNGVSGGTYTSSANFSDTNNGIGVAPTYTPTSQYFGYISNLRIVNGTAVYTSAFTPPIQPLIAISGTTLLTCADNRFIDDSNNNFTLTRNGDVSVQKFSPFGPQTQIVPTSYSVYFDGTGDYLETPSNATFNITGVTSYTIECWFYATSLPAALKGLVTSFNGTNGGSFWMGIDASNKMNVRTGNDASVVSGATTIVTNQWYHMALIRDGASSMKGYLNGVLEVSSASFNWTGQTQACFIGSYSSGTGPFTGIISNARVVNGTVVYTGAFTPPTTPLTAIANTSLLTCQSTTIIDNSTNNFTITVNGNSQPLAQNPFGYTNPTQGPYTVTALGGSMYFDGTGDSLLVATNGSLAMGSGIFTIELWHYALPRVSSDPAMLSNWTSTWGANFWTLHDRHSAYNTKYTFWVNNFNASAPLLTSTATVKEYQWTHLVITRSGSTWRMYVNGALDTTATSAVALDAGTTYPISVGVTSGSSSLSGYLSSIRFIKNQQLYTNAFVPSSAPLTSVQNSVLLLNGTSAGVTDSSMIANYETVGGAAINTSIVKFAGKSSIFFNGTNSGLFSPSSPNLSYGSGDFTIEFWYYPTSTAGTNPNIMCNWSGSGSFVSGQWSLHAPHANYANKYSLWVGSFNTGAAMLVSTSNIATNTWTFVTITRTTNTWRMFINGTIEATATHSGVFDSGGSWPRYIGYQPSADSGRYITGYMSDIRFTKGQSRYTANFTAPTTPFIQF